MVVNFRIVPQVAKLRRLRWQHYWSVNKMRIEGNGMRPFEVVLIVIMLILCLSGCQDSNINVNQDTTAPSSQVLSPKSGLELKDNGLEEAEKEELEEDLAKADDQSDALGYKDVDLLYSTKMDVTQEGHSYKIDLVGLDEEVTGLYIYDSAKGALVQDFSISRHIGKINPSYGFYVGDYNFDGFMDMGLQLLGGAGANTVFSYWVWNPEAKIFEYHSALSALTAVSFYPEDQRIVSENSSGAGTSYIEKVYRFEQNELVEVKLLLRKWDHEAEVFVYSFYEYVDGEQALVLELVGDPDGDGYEHYHGTGIWQSSDLTGQE